MSKPIFLVQTLTPRTLKKAGVQGDTLKALEMVSKGTLTRSGPPLLVAIPEYIPQGILSEPMETTAEDGCDWQWV